MTHHGEPDEHRNAEPGPTEDADGTTQSDAGLSGTPPQNAAPEDPNEDADDDTDA